MRGRCPRQQHRGLQTREEVSRTEGASGPSGTLDALGEKGCGRQAKASDAGKARPWGPRAAWLSPIQALQSGCWGLSAGRARVPPAGLQAQGRWHAVMPASVGALRPPNQSSQVRRTVQGCAAQGPPSCPVPEVRKGPSQETESPSHRRGVHRAQDGLLMTGGWEGGCGAPSHPPGPPRARP